MTYCINFITCLYYKLTNCKVGMLNNQEVQMNKVTSNCTLYKTQAKRIPNTDYCHLNTLPVS